MFLGCSEKQEQPLDSIGSKYVRNDILKQSDLSAESYSNEALKILENHKKELKSILPQMILDEISEYKNTLIEIEKTPAKAFSLEETNQLIQIEGINTGNRLFKKSILLNQHYFKLFNELSILNIKYNIDNKIVFKDFYDAGPIVLSDEVLDKIDELIKDEKIRVEIENNDKIKGYAFTALTVISTITGHSQNKEKLMNLTRGLKAAKNSIILEKSPSMLAKYTSKFLDKDLAVYTAKKLNNQKLRDKVADNSALIGATSSILGGLKTIQTNKPLQSFKNIENKMSGRIGDFSDGILSVHMQSVRDIIKLNAGMIK